MIWGGMIAEETRGARVNEEGKEDQKNGVRAWLIPCMSPPDEVMKGMGRWVIPRVVFPR